MTLRAWILKTGPKNAAKLLKVEPATLSCWKTRKSFPKAKSMIMINKLSKGQVTFEHMVRYASRR